MASERQYQTKIIKHIESKGGVAINGAYTVSGEADLQCGYPIDGYLMHLAVEVKTPDNYDRVMSALKEVDGLYEIIDDAKLKEHEPLQVTKINRNRKRGGLALFAATITHIEDYLDD